MDSSGGPRSRTSQLSNFFLSLLLIVTPAGGVSAQDSLCAARSRDADPSLYCLPLHPTAQVPLASGTAVLRHDASPFGLPVSREGRVRFRMMLTLSGLPDPEMLGGYRSFFAWATTPDLEPMIALGPVGNGQRLVGPIDLERFIILISAESSATPHTPHGPFVLRGSSPSLFMAPHGVTDLPPSGHAQHEHARHEWIMPPEHPGVSRMPYGLERFLPDVSPFLPPRDSGLPESVAPRSYQLDNGDTITITAGKVVRKIRGHSVVMYAYDGQIPAPGSRFRRAATVTVRFRNLTDLPSSIHWHGLRLANADDGVPGLTQPAVPPGGEFVYQVHAPDAGLFWYHPHTREDVAQDLGLAGNIAVGDGADGDRTAERSGSVSDAG